MQPYQIIIALIAGFMLVQGILKYVNRKSHYTILKLATQFIVWGGMAFVVLFPDKVMTKTSEVLGVKDNFNSLILIGFMFIIIMVFRLLGIIENLERNMTLIIRQEALRELRKKR